MFECIRYYATEEEFGRFRDRLKLVHCPHCGRVGTLVLHGFLTGFPEYPTESRIVRGRRIYCNKRRRRRAGCGRTVGILRAGWLRGFALTAVSLWRFFKGLVRGASARQALCALGTDRHERGAGRLRDRLAQAQSRIRARLARHVSVPEPPDGRDPSRATFAHLLAAFPDSPCPVAAFQHRFQDSFL